MNHRLWSFHFSLPKWKWKDQSPLLLAYIYNIIISYFIEQVGPNQIVAAREGGSRGRTACRVGRTRGSRVSPSKLNQNPIQSKTVSFCLLWCGFSLCLLQDKRHLFWKPLPFFKKRLCKTFIWFNCKAIPNKMSRRTVTDNSAWRVFFSGHRSWVSPFVWHPKKSVRSNLIKVLRLLGVLKEGKSGILSLF